MQERNSWTPGATLIILFFLITPSLLAQKERDEAERIARDVIEACGGTERWENTRYFHWNFFGSRQLWWDKEKGRVRIEVPKKELIMIADLDEEKGKAWRGGKPVKDSSERMELVRQARRIWANDSYWLFMPFKMLDPGVELEHLGVDSLSSGPAHKLRMTFDSVGFTPSNKYHVWVDQDEKLVRKWAYFATREKEEADLSTPWRSYREYNCLLLSGDRGKRSITDIRVPESFPEGTFEKMKVREQ
jgi:hypothetical protein